MPAILFGGTIGVLMIAGLALAGLAVPISAPQPLNTNAAGDTGQDRVPRIAAGANGRWIAVWESSENLGGTIGTDFDIFRAVSNDHGVTWSPPVVLNSNSGADGTANDLAPSIATDGAGTWVAVWEGRDSLGGTVGTEPDIFFTRSVDDGMTWSPVAALNLNAVNDDGTDLDPQVLYANGTWAVVWHSTSTFVGTIGPDADILIARSTNGGETWTFPAPLNPNAATDGTATDAFVNIASDGAGNWITVWQSTNTLGGTIGSDYDIFFSRSADHAVTWSPVAALNSNAAGPSGEDAEPVIATDGNGVWIVAWSSLHTLGGTIGPDRDVLFSRSIDLGTNWSTAAPLNSNAFLDTGNDHSPSVATDGGGLWTVVWHSFENLNGVIGADADLLFAVSEDAGMTWSTPGIGNTNAVTDSGADEYAALAVDATGAWNIVWKSSDSLNGTIGMEPDVIIGRFSIPDCNLNAVPDAAEPDCNGNNVPDDCDITAKTSDDVNENGIPDECEPPPPLCPADVSPPGDPDGVVGVPDLLFIINNWGPCVDPNNCPADLAPIPTGDDTVGVPDLLFIINNWGPCE